VSVTTPGDQVPGEPVLEQTTELAVKEKRKLVRSLRRLDMIGFTVCAFVGLDTLGTVASSGWQGFTWLVVLALLFVLPYALLMAEVGSAFTQEGGPYEWVKLAFGRVHAAIAAVLYWVTNPLWVGGSLAFIATDAWRANVFSVGHGNAGDYIFKFLFIWISIGVAIVSLRKGKWIPNFGALMRVVVLGFFTITVILYAFKHGVHGPPLKDLKPTGAVFLALVPLLLFNYVGFELQNGAAEEMTDPQRDVPISVVRSAVAGVLLYAIPIAGIIIVLPSKAITGIGGFIDAVGTVFSVYGGAAHTLLTIMTLCFVITLLTSGAVWMIGSDRIQAVSALDGSFPGFFGVFNKAFGTPVRVNTLSGIVSTVFMVVAVAAFNSGSDAAFQVVLDIAISTTLISYLWIFPAALKLRYTHPGVGRPYRFPFGTRGVWIGAALTTFWVALGSWVAVFPGTLEELFGLQYDFKGTWSVSRAKFEALTLGTLAVILVVALIGYWMGRPVRARQALVALEDASALRPAG
jgi:amino acid transporter